MPTSTSAIAAALAVEGFVLQIGVGSPVSYSSVANIQDWNEPNKSDVVDITNVGDAYKRRIPTLLDIGVCKAKLFWVPTEPSHQNAINGVIKGLRYLWINQILTAFQVVYPNLGQSVDRFQCYVTSFMVTGKVGGVFEAEIEFTPNDGNPTLA
jgi:hypothetical protein